MDLVLVANAASGSGTDVGEVERLLRERGARVRTLDLEAVDGWLEGGDARAAARLAAGADRIAVCGGDGSMGPAAALAAAAGVPLAVIPTGTANDFARHLDLPLDAAEAATIAADPDAALRRIDLAWAGSVPFMNAASAGLSVEAARPATPMKPVHGPLAYLAAAAVAGARGEPLRCRVACDGSSCFEGEAWQVTVAGTGAFGAGSEIEAADPDDGALDVAVMEAGRRIRLARHAVGLRTGRLTDQPGVLHVRGAEVTVTGAKRWNVDGDERELDPGGAVFRVERKALEVVAGR